MSDLHAILGDRATLLAMSMRDAPEFDAVLAKRTVRRRRTTRTTLVGTAAGIALIAVAGGAFALATHDTTVPVATPSPTPSASPSHSPSPSASPSISPVAYEGRNPDLTDEEAVARAENPATGEEWLETPKLVHPGGWATDPVWSGFEGVDPGWYMVGHRDGNDILSLGLQGILVEVAADGSPRAIVAPRPDQKAQIPQYFSEDDYPIAVDTSIYYDSLALPATATTPEGNTVDLRVNAGLWSNAPTQTTLVSVYGGSSLLRGTQPVAEEYWGAEADAILVANGAEKVHYFVRTPYGSLTPVPIIDDRNPVDWARGYGSSSDVYIGKIFTVDCGITVPYEMAISPDTGGDWESAGQAPAGEALAPTESNELGKALYKSWRELANDTDYGSWDAITSLDDYLHVPAITAIRTADPDVWWLVGDAEVMAIQGC